MKKSEFIERATNFLEHEFSDKQVESIQINVSVHYKNNNQNQGAAIAYNGASLSKAQGYDQLNYSYFIEKEDFKKWRFSADFKETVENDKETK